MRRTFYSFMLVAFLVFALFSLGGCGGSSNHFSSGGNNPGGNNSGGDNPGGNDSPEQSQVTNNLAQKLIDIDSDMASVMYNDEWDAMIDEYKKTGSADKMNPHTWVFCLTDEEVEQLREEYGDDDLSLSLLETFLFNEETIARDYENENDILLIYPDEEFINRTLEAVGYEGNFALTSDDAKNGRLEMFAIAKRTINGRTHTFTYYATCDDAYTLSDDLSAPDTSGDERAVLSGDMLYFITEDGSIVDSFDLESEDEKEINPNGDETLEVFTLNRWKNYYDWCASLTDWAREQSTEASSIEVYSAATMADLTKISEAQTETFDFAVNRDNYEPWGNLNGGDKVNIRRDNSVALVIYSCHSFTSGSDYYLVKATARTATKYYQDRVLTFRWKDDTFNKTHGKWNDWSTANMGGHKDPVNYISGFTKSMQITASVTGPLEERFFTIWGRRFKYYVNYNRYSIPDVGVLANTPTNVPRQTEYTNSMNWNLGGTAGGAIGGGKDGITGQISGGVSYTNSKKFTKKAYEIINAISGNNPSWKLSYGGIREGSWHVELYRGINPPEQSTENVEFESEWIWEVRKAVWTKEGKNLNMRLLFESQEGFAFGNGESNLPVYSWNNQEKYPTFDRSHFLPLRQPAHFWMSTRIYSAGAEGAKGLGFRLLSEGDWEVTNVPSWVHFSNNGGSTTGGTETAVWFDVDANTGGTRDAKMVFTMKVGSVEESQTIELHQNSK